MEVDINNRIETWRKHQNLKRPQTFVNKSRRRILKIFLPRTISHVELLANDRFPLSKEVLRRRWRWI